MPIIAKAGGGSFIPAPVGTWAAVCCDVVDLGVLEVNFGGETKKQHKIRIVWQLDEVREDNKPHQASKRYTLSLHEKASLRKDLESWRGRAFTEDELHGFDVEAVIGVGAYVNIIEEKKNGQTYSNVASIMRLPKGVHGPTVRDYVRVCDRENAADSTDAQPYGEITDDDIPF